MGINQSFRICYWVIGVFWGTGVECFENFLAPIATINLLSLIYIVSNVHTPFTVSNSHGKLNTLRSWKCSKITSFRHILHGNLKWSFVTKHQCFLEAQQFLVDLHKNPHWDFYAYNGILWISYWFRWDTITKSWIYSIGTLLLSHLLENYSIHSLKIHFT